MSPKLDPYAFARRELANGIPVYVNLSFPVEAVTLALVYFAGSRDEAPGTEGCAHFMEHMPFRGTGRFTSKNALLRPIEERGGILNAFTSSEHIVFFATTAPEDIRYATDALGDMARHALFRPKDFAEEREIVIREYRDNLADVSTAATKACYEELFRGHPLARLPLGNLKALQKMKLKDVRGFYERHIRENPFALIAAGGAEEGPVLGALEERFGSFRPAGRIRHETAPAPAVHAKRLIITGEPYGSSALFMAAPAFPFGDLRRLAAASVLKFMAGGGLSSPLYNALREREALVYSFHFDYDGWSDAGAFEFGVTTKFAQFDRVAEVFFNTIRSLRGNRARLALAKELLLKRDRMADRKISHAFEDCVEYVSCGIEPVPRYARRAFIAAVAMEEVEELIMRDLARERFTQVAVEGRDQ